MIHAVIIDDEEISLKSLEAKIRTHCPDIKVIKAFSRPEDALQEIGDLNPDLLFLDIEMPRLNGFGLLRALSPVNFEVIFTTAYSQYAIEALRVCALDFLTKPIDAQELQAAVERLKEKIRNRQHSLESLQQQLQLLLQYARPDAPLEKIAIPVMNGLEFVDVNRILKVRAENVYSVFYFSDGRSMTASITLKEVEAMLQRSHFFRVHKSHIVNLKFITQYTKGEGGTIRLSDGSEVEVSRRNKAGFLERFKI
jgi:two-component system, LytTR family, response regulator